MGEAAQLLSVTLGGEDDTRTGTVGEGEGGDGGGVAVVARLDELSPCLGLTLTVMSGGGEDEDEDEDSFVRSGLAQLLDGKTTEGTTSTTTITSAGRSAEGATTTTTTPPSASPATTSTSPALLSSAPLSSASLSSFGWPCAVSAAERAMFEGLPSTAHYETMHLYALLRGEGRGQERGVTWLDLALARNESGRGGGGGQGGGAGGGGDGGDGGEGDAATSPAVDAVTRGVVEASGLPPHLLTLPGTYDAGGVVGGGASAGGDGGDGEGGGDVGDGGAVGGDGSGGDGGGGGGDGGSGGDGDVDGSDGSGSDGGDGVGMVRWPTSTWPLPMAAAVRLYLARQHPQVCEGRGRSEGRVTLQSTCSPCVPPPPHTPLPLAPS